MVLSRKVTDPVAVEGATVVLKVTSCPVAAGLGDAFSVIDVGVRLMICETDGDVLAM